jgi:hypothetical protein
VDPLVIWWSVPELIVPEPYFGMLHLGSTVATDFNQLHAHINEISFPFNLLTQQRFQLRWHPVYWICFYAYGKSATTYN